MKNLKQPALSEQLQIDMNALFAKYRNVFVENQYGKDILDDLKGRYVDKSIVDFNTDGEKMLAKAAYNQGAKDVVDYIMKCIETSLQ